MTYQLMNFNITNDLKAVLDKLSKRKHVSRTSILNSLIATSVSVGWIKFSDCCVTNKKHRSH